MKNLADQQAALLEAMFAWPAENAMKRVAAGAVDMGARGLKAYQSNAHALSERALHAAFPVVAQMVGEESFASLARALWHAHPPQRGDIAQWGEALPAFVAAIAQLAEYPYLDDVARCEWALHRCATADDGEVDAPSLGLLGERDPAEIILRLSAGCALVESRWPVVSLVLAHLEESPRLQTVRQELQAKLAQSAVVWRQRLRPRLREAMAGETEFLRAVLQVQTLQQALDCAPELDASAWLTEAVQSGLLLGLSAAPNTER